MEQEKSNEVLVVKSDKEWMRYIYRDKTVALLMSMVLLSGTWVGIFLYGVSNGTVKKTSNIILFIFAFMIIAEIIVILLDIYRYWRDIGRELVLDETGILAKLLFYEKKYQWSDFKIKQLRSNLGERVKNKVDFRAHLYKGS